MPLALALTEKTQKRPRPEVSSVPQGMVDKVWPSILPMIEKGLSRGQGDNTTAEHMKAAVMRGDMYLWVIHEGYDVIAGIVLSVRERENSVKVSIEMLAGKDMNAWADDLQKLLIDFKDLVGASCIEASCRHGLARFLKGRGWTNKAVIMELK